MNPRVVKHFVMLCLIALAGCQPKPTVDEVQTGEVVAESPIAVRLIIGNAEWLADQERWSLPVRVRFYNLGETVFELDKQTGCEDGGLRNNVFEVFVDGVEAQYLGMMAKRAHPGPDGFFKIPPRGEYVVDVDLGAVYALPERGGALEVRFDHFNHFSVNAVQLTSDVATTRL